MLLWRTVCVSLALSLITVSAVSVSAEPTPTVRWLMNEPASLFDIGMMRLRDANKSWWTPAFFEEVAKRNLNLTRYERGGIGAAVYTWDENTIQLDVSTLGPLSESLCATALEIYKDVISPSRARSGPSRDFAVSLLTHFFDHVNHSSARTPKNVHENLANLFVFSVGIYDSRDSVTNSSLFCQSKLFDSVPTFQKFGKWAR